MPYLVTNMTQQKISYNLVEIHVYEFVFFFSWKRWNVFCKLDFVVPFRRPAYALHI